MTTPDEDPHPNGDDNRYNSSKGWDPHKPKTKIDERELARKAKRAREKYLEAKAAHAAIEVRAASEWLADAEPPEPRRDLFPPFWREGELAVLTGPPAVGKSLLAVQIADSIARGSEIECESERGSEGAIECTVPPSLPHTLAPSQQVLLLDLARTPRQLAERYTTEGEPYKFSENLELGLLADVEMPESYRHGRERFYLDAISHRLAESEAPVVIIDNLSWLTRSGGAGELRSLMKTFRRWTGETGRSMLLLRHSREDGFLHDQPSAFEMAHSIFALCRSTMGDNIRYVKALRQRFRIESRELRMEDSLSENSQFSILNSPFSEVMVLRTTHEPFFEFAGVSPEDLHFYDHIAHAKRVQRRLEQIDQQLLSKRLDRSSKILNSQFSLLNSDRSPRLSLVPAKRVSFLDITSGTPTNSES